MIRNIVNPTEGSTVNDQITLQDINLPEPNIALPLQLLLNVTAIIVKIANNVLTKISQKTLPDLPEPEAIVIDTNVDQGSDTEKINYFEDKYIGKILPEMPDEQQQIPQELLDSLTRIGRISIYLADIYDFHRLVRVKEHEDKTVRYMEKWDEQKRRKPREPLDIRKKVLFIAECLKKKDVPGVFYNRATETKSFFDKSWN